MGAAKFVGRVGGLAVALGVGAAAFTSQGTAWADTGSSPGSSQDGGSVKADSAGSSGSTSSKGTSRGSSARSASSSGVVSTGGAQSNSRHSGAASQHSLPSASASATATAAASAPEVPVVVESPQIDAVASAPAPSGDKGSSRVAPKSSLTVATSLPLYVPAAAAAPAGAVSGFLSAVIGDLFDSSAGGNPSAPADSPLAWALLGFARREAASAAAAGSPTASVTASAIFGNSIVTNQSVVWVDGILRGTVGATSTNGLPLTYKVVDAPSLGGKITLLASASPNPGNFSYLADMSTLTNPSLNEQFSIRVTETTAFDSFLTGIPIIGLLAGPIIDLLHQVPILNQLLAPIIGDSQVVAFDENPSTLAAGRPVDFTYMMPSFDGTLISVNYFPAADVADGDVTEAPTVLNGPGLGSPGNTNPDSVADGPLSGLVPGLVPLRTDASGVYDGSGGYNVITWDPRGEFASGGILQLDSPFWEGRDTSSIIDWAISNGNPAQSQIKMESPGDPLLGMVGGSYGGGIQMAVAGTPDKRIDAIVPTITWNSLTEALYPTESFKTAWSDILLLALVATGARINNQIYSGILTGNLFARISETALAVLAGSGSTMLVNNVDVPSLFVQGYTDGLFTLAQSITNSEQVATSNPLVPNKMVWVCQGHGACLDPQPTSQSQIIDNLKWLDQYVAGSGTPADSIPNFTWYDQKGIEHTSTLMPYDPGFNDPTPVSATGAGGHLLIAPIIGGSGPGPNPPGAPTAFTIPTEARNALNVDVAVPNGTVIAGAPTLSFTYSGLGTNRAVYAQLIDNATGRVVGNMVTPIPVTMDGKQHTVDLPMENITYTAGPTDSMTLQITSSATAYENFTAWGLINISNIDLSIPTVA